MMRSVAVSMCTSAYFGALRTIHSNSNERSGPHRVGHRLCAVALQLNCRSSGWNSGSSPINARLCLSSLLSHM